MAQQNMKKVRNPVLAQYIEGYQEIYDDFMQNVAQFGVPFAENQEKEIEALRAELKALGVTWYNNGASLCHGEKCGACQACRTGAESYTGMISLMCHRKCFFCFNPNQTEYDQLATAKKDWAAEMADVYRRNKHLRFIALTGGEPLLHKQEAIAYFRQARSYWPDISMRLYTSGDLLDEETLAQLADAGLEEIRFSLKLDDEPERMEKVFAAMALAKGCIPRVMVEMPVMPDAEAEMMAVLDRLEAMGVFGINLLELCFPFFNAEEFTKRGYALRNPPYRTLYNFWYAGGMPVAGSELLGLKLLRYAVQKGMRLSVHYCSLENKHFGQLYMQNIGAERTNPTYVMSPTDFYLKTIKAFGKDAELAERMLRANRKTNYRYERENGFIQLSPSCASALKGSGMELAISFNVREVREGEACIRELRLDPVKASEFDPSML